MPKGKSLVSAAVDTDAESVTWTFPDGRTVTVSLRDVPENLVRLLALHGLKQKGSDSGAGAANAVAEGKAPTKVAYYYEQLTRVAGNLRSGTWADKGSGATSYLAQAISRVMGIPIAQVATTLAAMSEKEKADAAAAPKVKVAIAELKAEAAARKLKALEASTDDDEAIPGFEDFEPEADEAEDEAA